MSPRPAAAEPTPPVSQASPSAASSTSSASDWARMAERGSLRALRFGVWAARRIGRRPMETLLWGVAAYFALVHRAARRGSRQYLERLWSTPGGRMALGRAPDWRTVLRHVHTFAVSIYDRVLVFGGALDDFELEHDGSGKVFDWVREGRGALLLGAHLGSFELLWLLSREYDLPVGVVAFHRNSQQINAVMRSMNPDARVGVIEIDPHSVGAAFELKARVDRGELVVILADRVGPFETRRETARLLGRPAAFPFGPFRLAVALGCPVALALCLRTGSARYRTILRPLREAGRVPRADRDEAARELLTRYVQALEGHCESAPMEWFNFFPFWADDA